MALALPPASPCVPGGLHHPNTAPPYFLPFRPGLASCPGFPDELQPDLKLGGGEVKEEPDKCWAPGPCKAHYLPFPGLFPSQMGSLKHASSPPKVYRTPEPCWVPSNYPTTWLELKILSPLFPSSDFVAPSQEWSRTTRDPKGLLASTSSSSILRNASCRVTHCDHRAHQSWWRKVSAVRGSMLCPEKP